MADSLEHGRHVRRRRRGPLLRNLLSYPAGRSHAIAQQAGTRSAAPSPAKRARYAVGGSPTISRKVRAERAEAVESDVEADLGHGTVGLAQQLHRTLHPAALQVAVRRLAKRRPELAAEVRRRDVRDARERRHVERLRKRTVHRVASPQHPAVALLDGARHLLKPTTCPRAAVTNCWAEPYTAQDDELSERRGAAGPRRRRGLRGAVRAPLSADPRISAPPPGRAPRSGAGSRRRDVRPCAGAPRAVRREIAAPRPGG